MRKIIVLLILPIIGFSQSEDPILDELLQSSEVNQYFQLAISLNVAELQFLNDCDSDVNYTMFAPGNDVPNESAALLLGLEGELIDYISYYIHAEPLSMMDLNYIGGFPDIDSPGTIEMLDGNDSNIQHIGEENVLINESQIIMDSGIETCNGVIYIIDDLIWAPGVISLNERNSLRMYLNHEENLLKFPKMTNKGLLEIRDINGKIILSQTVENTTTINTDSYGTGMYIVQLKTATQNSRELLFIN